MTRAWLWLRLMAGVVVLALLLHHFGAGPFTEAWRATTWESVLAAFALTAVATLTSAWRWRVVARTLGNPLTVRASVLAYYRSQFLNAVLPGGVLGDAERAMRHGRTSGDLGNGVRATVGDRVSGQVVQVGVTLLALVLLPTPWRSSDVGTAALLALLVGAAVLALVVRRRPEPWVVPVVVASVGSTAAHLALFVVAAATVGVTASPTVLVATGLVVLVGSAIPLSIAGWGPREGVTAWAFGLVGLGAATGLTVAVVYGVLAAVATLPGALVVLGDVVARRRAPGTTNGDTAGEAEEEDVEVAHA
jgi:glycosyltransferase 2 family protein